MEPAKFAVYQEVGIGIFISGHFGVANDVLVHCVRVNEGFIAK